MDQTIEDGIGERRISKGLLPVLDGELARDDCGAAVVAIFQQFQQIPSVVIIECGEPPIIEDCGTVEWRPGYILKIDLSQIELRVAAFLSGDPDMLGEYERGVDRHWDRACEIWETCGWGPPCKTHGTTSHHKKGCDECNLSRQVGKQVNFLIIYYGGAWRLRETLRKEVGFNTTLEACQQIVTYSRRRYPHYMARPLGRNASLNCLLVVEFCDGTQLHDFIVKAIREGAREPLFQKLTALAYFLATLHNRTANGLGVEFTKA